MHIEPPKVSLHSVKEFITHYLMIVLSVLTALGLEAFLEHRHHVHAAEAAQEAIEAELQDNIVQIKSMARENEVRLRPLKALDERLSQELRDGKPRAGIADEISALVRADKVDLGMFVPTLRHEAWDVAVANQAATWIDRAVLSQYARAYAQQREMESSENSALFDGPRFIDAMTDARAQGADPVTFLRAVSQATVTMQALQNRLGTMQASLLRALPADKADAARDAQPVSISPATRAPAASAMASAP
jgi:hypothetical protein